MSKQEVAVVLFMACAVASAQDTLPPPEAGLNTFKFVASEAAIPGKVVKGAPYSATAVTETVQTLPDGNRITQKITSFVARDSEGRTRREQSLPVIGPWASGGADAKIVTINDPVNEVSYMLDDRDETARKLPAMQPLPGKGENVLYQKIRRDDGQAAPAAGVAETVIVRTLSGPPPKSVPAEASQREKLGQTSIEGVMADGERTTTVVPAGAVGNDRPITVTDEKWYSPELQTTVLSKHSDPRMGETTFRLTNISRSEPPAALFQVPADYQIIDSGKGMIEVKIDKK